MIEIGNNTLSSVVRLTTSGSEMDMQLAEQLKNKIEEVTEDIDIEIDLLPPSLPSITLPSSSYSFLIHQSISFTIDMNGVMNCHITPSLPQGLILNRTTCTISGTLTSLSFSSYNITAISHSNTFIRIVSIEIISSLISYPQTNLIIGQGLSFSITPNLTKVSTISIVSGSLPIGLSINPSTGVISGSPSQLLSSQSVTIEAMSGTAIETVVLSFTVITPISSFSYLQSSYVLSKNHPFSTTPTVDGDEVSFSISSGSLPMGLSLNPSNGMISGTLSTTIKSISLTVEACNGIGSIQTQLSFSVKALSSLSILLISLAILILIIVVVIGIIRKKSHMHLDRKRGSRKLPISYPTKLNHTPQTEKSSISVDNPPNMLSNIIVYDPPTPSHSS